MFKRLGNLGFGLIQAMIAASVLAGVGLVATRLFQTNSESQKEFELKSDIETVVNQIKEILSSRTNCTATFGPVDPSTGTISALQKELSSGFAATLATNVQLPGNLRIVSYKLTKSLPALAPNQTALQVEFKIPKSGIREKTVKIITLDYTGTSTVDTCIYRNADLDDSIWVLNPNNSIYFTGGNASIGGTLPTRLLEFDVKQTSKTGMRVNTTDASAIIFENYNGVVGLGWLIESVGLGSRHFKVVDNSGTTALWADTFNSNLGIATTSAPTNKLDVRGNMVIGAGLAGITSAPTNGLLVQGGLGIGTTTMGTSKVNINGALVSKTFSNSSNIIDFTQGNTQITSYPVNNGLFSLCGMTDGGIYTLVMTSQPVGSSPIFTPYEDTTCLISIPFFEKGGQTFTTSKSTSIINLIRAGDSVYAFFMSDHGGTPLPCAAVASKSWVVGGQTCSAPLTLGTSGSSQTIVASGNPAGSASFTCTSGSWIENAGSTCSAPVFPTSLALTHTSNNKDFTVSWTAGSGNGGPGGCKLQYYQNGSTWTDLSGSYNCDANASNVSASLPSSSSWTSNFNASGVTIRLVRISDTTSSSFPQTTTCTAVAGSPTSTPNFDENCNAQWDDSSGGGPTEITENFGPCNFGSSYSLPATKMSGSDTCTFSYTSFHYSDAVITSSFYGDTTCSGSMSATTPSGGGGMSGTVSSIADMGFSTPVDLASAGTCVQSGMGVPFSYKVTSPGSSWTYCYGRYSCPATPGTYY